MQEKLPTFWKLLSESDQRMYRKIQEVLSQLSTKNKRNTKIDDFRELVDAIDIFENYDKESKWRRCLACGLVKFDGGIAVITSQLSILALRCKTSINTSLKGMGYTIISGKSSESEEFLKEIPYISGNPSEMRQWTVRYLEETSYQYQHQYISPPEGIIPETPVYQALPMNQGQIEEIVQENSLINNWEDDYSNTNFDLITF